MLWLKGVIFFALLQLLETAVVTYRKSQGPDSIDVVIPLKTSLIVAERLVNSLLKHNHRLLQRVIFVEDGSTIETQEYIRKWCRTSPNIFICLATTKEEPGYSFAANMGINYGANASKTFTRSKAIVLLSADAIVTDDWLRLLYFELSKGENIRVVGPVSNAASFQSVPDIMDTENGNWSTNAYPIGMDIDNTANEIRAYAKAHLMDSISVTVLNGFCFMFKRKLVEEIGQFNHLVDSGADFDFLMRAHKAGFLQHVVPSVYIYQSVSSALPTWTTPSSREKQRTAKKNQTLAKSSGKFISSTAAKSPNIAALDGMRDHMRQYYESFRTRLSYSNYNASILFVLHDLAIAGGVVSVLQEAWQMHKYGVNVSLAFPAILPTGNTSSSTLIRSLLPGIKDEAIAAMTQTYDKTLIDVSISIPESFIKIAKDYNIVVATFCKTMRAVQEVRKQYPQIMPAYYVQDYEPWFWENPWWRVQQSLSDAQRRDLEESRASYTKDTSFMIAKTEWTANMVRVHHNATVHMVVPSIDHQKNFIDNHLLTEKLQKKNKRVFNIIAMIRPRTVRRNAIDTLEVVLKLAYSFPNSVKVTLFGCNNAAMLSSLNKNRLLRGSTRFRPKTLSALSNVAFKGVLVDRQEIANLFRHSDIFVDLSWWQAFGRTAMEAMANGCVAIMPLTGAAPEICEVSEKNCLYHDGNDVMGYYKKIVSLMQNDRLRHFLVMNGLSKLRNFGIPLSAGTIANNLKRGFVEYQNNGYRFLSTANVTL